MLNHSFSGFGGHRSIFDYASEFRNDEDNNVSSVESATVNSESKKKKSKHKLNESFEENFDDGELNRSPPKKKKNSKHKEFPEESGERESKNKFRESFEKSFDDEELNTPHSKKKKSKHKESLDESDKRESEKSRKNFEGSFNNIEKLDSSSSKKKKKKSRDDEPVDTSSFYEGDFNNTQNTYNSSKKIRLKSLSTLLDTGSEKRSSNANSSLHNKQDKSSSDENERNYSSDIKDTAAGNLLNTYLSSNKYLKKISSGSNSRILQLLNKKNKIYIMQLPKEVDPTSLIHSEISIESTSTLELESEKYISVPTKQKQTRLFLLGKNKNEVEVENLKIAGKIKIRNNNLKIERKPILLECKHKNEGYLLDDIKKRHPVFGIDFDKKVELEQSVQKRFERTSKKFKKEKRKKNFSESDNSLTESTEVSHNKSSSKKKKLKGDESRPELLIEQLFHQAVGEQKLKRKKS